MTELAPLATLYEASAGEDVALPARLAALYGRFPLPRAAGRPHVIANFVATLDGVVALNEPGHPSGGDISGFDKHDTAVMGLLRAIADAVVVGAGTLRSTGPRHIWTAEYIHRDLADDYRALRRSLGKEGPPLNEIVTRSGELELSRRLFQSGEVPVLIVTSEKGASVLRQQPLPASVQVAVAAADGPLGARAILAAVAAQRACEHILVEGGPTLMGDFFAEQCIDEQWLTLAPQIAGRGEKERPGLVMGKTFAPDHPLWAALTSVRRSASHLFLRYAFGASAETPAVH